jgi:hypothetical protein
MFASRSLSREPTLALTGAFLDICTVHATIQLQTLLLAGNSTNKKKKILLREAQNEQEYHHYLARTFLGLLPKPRGIK